MSMSLAVARSPDHETWTWSDPELGSAGAWLGLGIFSAVVAAGFLSAWAVCRSLPDPSVAWLLLVSALGATVFSLTGTFLGMWGRRRKRRLAPSSVRVDPAGLAWADLRWAWSAVRSVGVGEREVDGGRKVPCVVVLHQSGAEVWLAVHQVDDDQRALATRLRAAWSNGARSGTGPAGGPRLRLVRHSEDSHGR
ncbi:MAG: hypothetical protein AB8H79_26990 [Myxococcota bacterium]